MLLFISEWKILNLILEAYFLMEKKTKTKRKQQLVSVKNNRSIFVIQFINKFNDKKVCNLIR